MGLSILRVHIDPNSRRFIEQVPTAQYATARGAKVLASPWDPPSALLDYSGNDPRLPYENYGAYVEHLNSFNTLMNDSGVPLYAISIQNEPDIGEWTDWSPSEILTFAREFAGDIETRVLAAESFNFGRHYTDPILNDSAASANVDIIGGHIYGNGLYDYPLARAKGKQVWMTEHLTGSDAPSYNNWSLALNLGKEIHDCMEANFSAYIWWYIRRFYGLIREEGVLSEKGYAMIHYSKFVRPGSVRVAATVSNATGIYATAFKTDTSMTIVALNITGGAVEVSFDVANSGHGDFVTFSSGATGRMVSKGLVSATEGTFSVTLDPRSISTITTTPGAAGRVSNQPPVAVAGQGRTLWLDADESGAAFTLDASGSSDPDGEIVSYSWLRDGVVVSDKLSHDLVLPAGAYSYMLWVTDNEGTVGIDTINLLVKKATTTDLWLEPECGEVGSAWDIVESGSASNNYYVTGPAGIENIEAPSELAEDLIRMDFNLTEKGTYRIWGRVIAQHGGEDSFWLRMDDADWIRWEGMTPVLVWNWEEAEDADNPGSLAFNLEAGDHTLQLCYREDGALLDKLLITNTGLIPSGVGGETEGCTVSAMDREGLSAGPAVFPNPSAGNFLVEWDQGFTRMEILSTGGKVLFTRNWTVSQKRVEVDSGLGSGLYLLRISGEARRMHRLVILEK